MKENVKISVIIPVYNAAAFLLRTVESILMQDFEDFEVILVNDGSTDSSAALCEQLSKQDSRVHVIHKENGGVSSARNTGLKAACGEFVMFVDADDLINEGSLAKMYSSNYDFVLAGFQKILPSQINEKYIPEISASYHGTDEICSFFDHVLPSDNTYILNSACFKLFRRDIIEANKIRFVEGLSFAEDKLFVLNFLLYADHICTVPHLAYTYLLREDSLSSDMKSESHAYQVFRLLESYAPLLERLESRYACSRRMTSLYHMDLVGRYVCRILGIFSVRKTTLMTPENITVLYDYMSADKSLGLISIRPGQVPNILLYKLNHPNFTCRIYRFTSYLVTLLLKIYKS